MTESGALAVGIWAYNMLSGSVADDAKSTPGTPFTASNRQRGARKLYELRPPLSNGRETPSFGARYG
ncbi:hypothetical protein NLG97_g5398 [Lecanicillium saksenae]|uniref:Uncharacterized protein n=1 Tax=Lecanicillium saksenae TaxID=468837 RepID=A0ACC1QVS6_9HYPO|nr:hypothetical protein NLG97_g5398 [Lecanicillium saksenae]